MGRFPRPCLKCGVLVSGESYCAEHKPVKIRKETPERKAIKQARYDATYKKLAKQVRLNAVACHLCGGGWREGDPWEADHIAPGEWGREYDLAAAHRSCNQSRGNKPLPTSETPRGEGRGRAGARPTFTIKSRNNPHDNNNNDERDRGGDPATPPTSHQ